MSCDVYTLGAPCGTVYVYPSQVHPHHHGRSSGPGRTTRHRLPEFPPLPREEADVLALALLLPYEL